MAKVSITSFSTFSSYLTALSNEKKAMGKKFSLRALGQRMGLKSPSALLMIASGKRMPSYEILNRMAHLLKFSDRERDYAEALLGLHKCKDEGTRKSFLQTVERISAKNKVANVDLDVFRLITHWYHMAIFEMTRLVDFRNDPLWIAKRLGQRITAKEAKEAVARMLRLGLLTQEMGDLKTRDVHLTAPQNIPSEAIRSNHRQTLSMAAEALSKQSVNERFVSSTTLAVQKDHIAAPRPISESVRYCQAQTIPGRCRFRMPVN